MVIQSMTYNVDDATVQSYTAGDLNLTSKLNDSLNNKHSFTVSETEYTSYPQSHSKSLIILITGVPGVGKTTVGNAMIGTMGLTHHISTGFLRAAVDMYLEPDQSTLLRRHAFDAYELIAELPPTGENIFQGALAQAELLKPIFKTCIARARREGIGLIMEGSHFIPGFVDPTEYDADLLCVLDVPNRDDLKARALSPNHLHRELSSFDLERLVLLQEQLLDAANLYNSPIIVNVDLDDAVQQIHHLLGMSSGTS